MATLTPEQQKLVLDTVSKVTTNPKVQEIIKKKRENEARDNKAVTDELVKPQTASQPVVKPAEKSENTSMFSGEIFNQLMAIQDVEELRAKMIDIIKKTAEAGKIRKDTAIRLLRLDIPKQRDLLSLQKLLTNIKLKNEGLGVIKESISAAVERFVDSSSIANGGSNQMTCERIVAFLTREQLIKIVRTIAKNLGKDLDAEYANGLDDEKNFTKQDLFMALFNIIPDYRKAAAAMVEELPKAEQTALETSILGRPNGSNFSSNTTTKEELQEGKKPMSNIRKLVDLVKKGDLSNAKLVLEAEMKERIEKMHADVKTKIEENPFVNAYTVNNDPEGEELGKPGETTEPPEAGKEPLVPVKCPKCNGKVKCAACAKAGCKKS